jgi:hypothetical protein
MPDFCLCNKDQDGQCPACKQILSGFLGQLVSLFKEFQEKVHTLTHGGFLEKPCDDCTKRYIDFVGAKLLDDMGKEVPEDISRALAGYIGKMAYGFGAAAIPLTEKAWTDICATQGWDP